MGKEGVENNSVHKESRLRSLIKGITWRVLGTMDTLLLSYFITKDTKTAGAIAGFELITKFILYYLHERAWQQMPRGNVRKIAQKLPPGLKRFIKGFIK